MPTRIIYTVAKRSGYSGMVSTCQLKPRDVQAVYEQLGAGIWPPEYELVSSSLFSA